MESTDDYSASTNTHAGAMDAIALMTGANHCSLGHLFSIHRRRVRVTQKRRRLVQQLPSCLGAKLRTGTIILLKSSNFCTSKEKKFHVQIFFYLALCEYDIWESCPVPPLGGALSFPSHGTCSVCVHTPDTSVCLVKIQHACPAHDRSGCPCFGYPVVLVPWQHWHLLIHPTLSGLHHTLCGGTWGVLHAWGVSLTQPAPRPSLRSFCLLLHLRASAWVCLDWGCLDPLHVTARGRDGHQPATALSLESGISPHSWKEGGGSLPMCSSLPSPNSQMSVKAMAMAMAQLHFTHTEMQFWQKAVSDCSVGIGQWGMSSHPNLPSLVQRGHIPRSMQLSGNCPAAPEQLLLRSHFLGQEGHHGPALPSHSRWFTYSD